ncbi:aromatic compound dioxygenase [Pseudovirgaria hyperparasitica]|uniref:Aromatic compound dioxygenase n=1 Tax=Pseudovirgaria hyperparasitica TaxID=470096 RepID=A0A6A6W396_9PEZI|nr:aromatic compound dioxygenase [Pseudovirgaria hyperparasitica]KAF2757332.1 aromatic compound dioxygenase [Pseudovirgaria hyperparasitica]
MVQLSSFLSAAAASVFLGTNIVLSHPGHDVKAEYAQRHAALEAMPLEKKSLARCAEKLKARGHEAKLKARREGIVANLREKRSIERRGFLRARDLDTVLATDHHSNLTGVSIDSSADDLFGTQKSCILSPEVTQGPYYVSGELIRQDITEGGDGVPLTVDVQLLDVNTCEPVPDVLVDFWHCNSTGVYSGVIASGNGDQSDTTNIDKTFLRGIQQTNEDGVLTFDTLFPGHYTGRAVHIHILSHTGATLQANNTITGGNTSHVGQIFFDQDLISTVEAQEPYASNTQELTENSKDDILAEEAGDIDPFIEYVLVGDDISDGVFGWIAFGIDPSASYDVSPAVMYYAEGGVENENSNFVGPGGAGGPPSGAPDVPGAPGTTPGAAATPTPTIAGVVSARTGAAAKKGLALGAAMALPFVHLLG